jgi:hypothetical protein
MGRRRIENRSHTNEPGMFQIWNIIANQTKFSKNLRCRTVFVSLLWYAEGVKQEKDAFLPCRQRLPVIAGVHFQEMPAMICLL